MKTSEYPIFTIGHSNHSPEEFIALLRRHNMDEVIDVRSAPYSRYAAQFNREPICGILEKAGFAYTFLGGELGGRPADRSCYDASGRVLYERIADTDIFEDGLAYLVRNADERQYGDNVYGERASGLPPHAAGGQGVGGTRY